MPSIVIENKKRKRKALVKAFKKLEGKPANLQQALQRIEILEAIVKQLTEDFYKE